MTSWKSTAQKISIVSSVSKPPYFLDIRAASVTIFWRLRADPWFLPKHLATLILTELSKLLSCIHHDLKQNHPIWLMFGMARMFFFAWVFGWASQLGFWWLDPDQSWPDPIRIHFCVWWSFKAITQEDIRSGSWKSTSPKENGCHQLSSPISEFCFSRFLSIVKFSVEKANVTLQVKVIPNTSLTFLATRTPSRFEWWSSWI